MVRFFGGVLSSLMGCFPLSAMALGFLLWSRGRRCEVMEVYASGFAGYQGAILLTVRVHWEWWLVGVRYWNTKRQGFLPECEGFHWIVFMVPELKIFCGFCAKGQEFLRVRLRESSRIRSKYGKVCIHKQKEIITIQTQKLKFHYLLPKNQASLVQTNQKACLAQTGDGWYRQ
jgi:hypothetical protein